MSAIIEKDVVFSCCVDTITHPNTMEEKARGEKSNLLWTTFRTYIKNGNRYEPRMCAGMAPKLDAGDNVTLTGDLVDTGKYGVQFQFNCVKKDIPAERAGLITFFTRNLNGVGQITAEKIVDKLGTAAVERIEEDYTVLITKVGLTEKKAINIANQIGYLHASVEELKFFAQTGLGSSKIAAVKQFYKDKIDNKKVVSIIDLIKENPYRLIDDIKGIGFKSADAVAQNIGMSPTDPNRIGAGLKFALKEEVDAKGNIWTSRDELIKLTASKNYLNVPTFEVAPILEDLIKQEALIEENERIYLPEYFHLEHIIADKIHSLQVYPCSVPSDSQIEAGIIKAQQVKGRTLDEGQVEAVKLCIKNNVSIITGGPGTGKTTTLDILLYFLEKNCNMIVTMCAPTGRAAKRMTEQTKRKASTIHSLSGNKCSEDFKAFAKCRHVIVIDESSMIDTNVLKMVVDLCDVSTKLIFVGDVDQLPSIGPGQVLRDMIESNAVATARLSTIHRQSGDSKIITNAHAIINGKHLVDNFARDFFVSEQPDEDTCLKIIKQLVCKHYPQRLGVKPEEIQILAPLKRGVLGVDNLNKVMQECLNPPAPNKKEVNMNQLRFGLVFREGDRVIQTKNDYKIPCEDGSEGVFNGEIGIISAIRVEWGELSVYVDYGERVAVYDAKQLYNLSLAYAITVHKSQGSEFPCVLLPLYMYSMPMIYNRNLLYTAVTRAKKYCAIIGQEVTVNKMIHNNKINRRRTTLAIRLNGLGDEFLEQQLAAKKTTRKTAKKSTAKKTTKKTTKKSKKKEEE